jgi:hypothetical protein
MQRRSGGGVEEGEALREELGGGGRKWDAKEGERGLGDVPHEGEGEVGVRAEDLDEGRSNPRTCVFAHATASPDATSHTQRDWTRGGEVVGAGEDGGEVGLKAKTSPKY